MVAVRPKSAETSRKSQKEKWTILGAVAAMTAAAAAMFFFVSSNPPTLLSLRHHPHSSNLDKPQVAYMDPQITVPESNKMCPYMKLSDLTQDELHPTQGSRHMVTPPSGGNLTLVCCRTTQGPWNILVHSVWAPNGANRFLDMVRSSYFETTGVPLMRCVKKFLCQFGLNSDPQRTKLYNSQLMDDPNWLPEGPTHREHDGVKRFAKGYLAYAGSGKNSRSNQFIVSLVPNGPLAGGSPWEVPWGELVGEHSFTTLDRIYTGYGENGPPQGLLHREGASEAVQTKWPEMDYIRSCIIADERIEEDRR